jgi:hypothetical protein
VAAAAKGWGDSFGDGSNFDDDDDDEIPEDEDAERRKREAVEVGQHLLFFGGFFSAQPWLFRNSACCQCA